ncbi:MAG: oligosaccharide flippase family protein, partial [Bdellovibrio sp.]
MLLILSTVAGQIIVFLSSIPLARFYTPEEFGIYANFNAFAAMTSVFVTLKYDAAIAVPSTDSEAMEIFIFSMFLTLFLLPVCLLVFMILSVFGLLGKQVEFGVSGYLALSLMILFQILSSSMVLLSIKRKKFTAIAVSRVIQPVLFCVVALLPLLFVRIGNGLVWSLIVSQGAVIIYFIMHYYGDLAASIRSMSLAKCKAIMSEYRRFPRFSFPHALVDAFQANAIVFVISSFFGTSSLGFYSMANRILRAPSSIVGTAISQVVLEKITNNRDPKYIKKLMKRMVGMFLALGIPASVLFYFLSNSLFVFLYGEKWIESGRIAQSLVIFVCGSFIVAPLTQIPYVLGRQRGSFLFGLATNVFYLGSLYLMAKVTKDLALAFQVASIFGVIVMIVFGVWSFKILDEKKS